MQKRAQTQMNTTRIISHSPKGRESTLQFKRDKEKTEREFKKYHAEESPLKAQRADP